MPALENHLAADRDRLNALMEGTAFIARSAAKKRAKASPAGQAYTDAVARILGEERPMRFTTVETKGFFSKMFGG